MKSGMCFQAVGTLCYDYAVFTWLCVMLNVAFILVVLPAPKKRGKNALITSRKAGKVNFCSHIFNQLLRV